MPLFPSHSPSSPAPTLLVTAEDLAADKQFRVKISLEIMWQNALVGGAFDPYDHPHEYCRRRGSLQAFRAVSAPPLHRNAATARISHLWDVACIIASITAMGRSYLYRARGELARIDE